MIFMSFMVAPLWTIPPAGQSSDFSDTSVVENPLDDPNRRSPSMLSNTSMVENPSGRSRQPVNPSPPSFLHGRKSLDETISRSLTQNSRSMIAPECHSTTMAQKKL